MVRGFGSTLRTFGTPGRRDLASLAAGASENAATSSRGTPPSDPNPTFDSGRPMKKELHPEQHPVVFIDPAADFEFVSRSTMTSDSTREIDGVEHYEIRLEISSASHPFFTGKQHFVDTAGRIEKFKKKYRS